MELGPVYRLVDRAVERQAFYARVQEQTDRDTLSKDDADGWWE